MSNWLFKNFWLKITALILAIIIWYYADVEIKRVPGEERAQLWFEYSQENMIKELKLIPVIVGRPAQNYAIRTDRITVKPETSFVIGPKRIVEKLVSLKTVQIDITGQSKTCSLTVPLEPVKSVRFYGHSGVVDITIPIVEKKQ